MQGGCIREQDPLKQGLKLKVLDVRDRVLADSRARSIKTRIETNLSMNFWNKSI